HIKQIDLQNPRTYTAPSIHFFRANFPATPPREAADRYRPAPEDVRSRAPPPGPPDRGNRPGCHTPRIAVWLRPMIESRSSLVAANSPPGGPSKMPAIDVQNSLRNRLEFVKNDAP